MKLAGARWSLPGMTRGKSGTYEIPITSPRHCSRIPMAVVAIQHGERMLIRPLSSGAQEHLMLDIVMLALGFGFFAASIGYAYACERL